MSGATVGSSDWIVRDGLEFLNNLFLGIGAVDPLHICLRRMCADMLGKLVFYSKANTGIYVFANVLGGPKGDLVELELHVLAVSKNSSSDMEYASERVDERNIWPGKKAIASVPPEFCRVMVVEKAILGAMEKVIAGASIAHPREQKGENLYNFAASLREILSNYMGSLTNAEEGLRAIVLPVGVPTEKYPASALGTVLLFPSTLEDPRANWKRREEAVIYVAKLFSVFMRRLLLNHYGATEETYLPSYRVPGLKAVAIMFLDVRQFTPTTEILRSHGKMDEWAKFMADWTAVATGIIQRHGGRVHCFAGDGQMAIFGEYCLDRSRVCGSAVDAAKSLVYEFNRISKPFVESALAAVLRDAYDTIELELGVGLNYGTVYFDYYGSGVDRSYSPIGDHVNFAQRLEAQAARMPQSPGSRRRANVLISRPVWDSLGRPEWSSITLELKGKPNVYRAWEVPAGTLPA